MVKTDRFGNAYQLIGCKPNKNGYAVGYMKIGNATYKIEPSTSNKEGVDAWVKVTRMKKREQAKF